PPDAPGSSGGCPRGCGNECSQVVDTQAVRATHFVSASSAPGGNELRRRKRSGPRAAKCLRSSVCSVVVNGSFPDFFDEPVVEGKAATRAGSCRNRRKTRLLAR